MTSACWRAFDRNGPSDNGLQRQVARATGRKPVSLIPLSGTSMVSKSGVRPDRFPRRCVLDLAIRGEPVPKWQRGEFRPDRGASTRHLRRLRHRRARLPLHQIQGPVQQSPPSCLAGHRSPSGQDLRSPALPDQRGHAGDVRTGVTSTSSQSRSSSFPLYAAAETGTWPSSSAVARAVFSAVVQPRRSSSSGFLLGSRYTNRCRRRPNSTDRPRHPRAPSRPRSSPPGRHRRRRYRCRRRPRSRPLKRPGSRHSGRGGRRQRRNHGLPQR